MTKTLRYLKLAAHGEWARATQKSIQPGQLANFPHLRTLILHETSVCREIDADDGGACGGDSPLVRVLSKFVETLMVGLEDGASVDDLENLVARADEFGALKKVKLGL